MVAGFAVLLTFFSTPFIRFILQLNRPDLTELTTKVMGTRLDYEKIQPMNAIAKNQNRGEDDYVIAELWATWCKPCIKLLPTYDRLYQNYKGYSHLSFMAISVDDRHHENKVNLFIERKDYRFPVYMDTTSSLMKTMSIPYIPLTVLVKNDTVIKTFAAAKDSETYYQELSSVLDSLLLLETE